MSVWQATGVPAVSLPNGCRSLPVRLLPWLERFDRIVLWMDDDAAGREGAERVAAKLGTGRCAVVRPRTDLLKRAAGSADGAAPAGEDWTLPTFKMPKDANEFLQVRVCVSVHCTLQPLIVPCCSEDTT
jgi:hypothetical protein